MTTFGIHARNYHLDPIDSAQVDPDELDWAALTTWYGAPMPSFAGRYFLADFRDSMGGPPTFAWGHGEGSAAQSIQSDMKRIVPIHAGSKERLELKAARGLAAGTVDGFAFASQVAACLRMGELKVTNETAYVFLDVPTGAHLTAGYWAGWANAVQIALTPDFQGPFQPCVCCDFSNSTPHQPDLVVEDALNKAKDALDSGQVRCFGYWAKVLIDPAPTAPRPALNWGDFGQYTQSLQLGTQDVPVLLWRFAIPDKTDAATDGFRLLTMDAANEDAADPCVSNQMLEIAQLDLESKDATAMGFDVRPPLNASTTACAKVKKLVITAWPKAQAGDVPHPVDWRMKPSYVGRYYSNIQSAKVLTRTEARMLTRSGLSIMVAWAPTVPYRSTTQLDMYTWLQQPDQGRTDAMKAFSYAADRIKQPPWTPIFFDIDFNLGNSKDDRNPDGTANVDPAEHTQDVQTLLSYFEGIAQGYRDYLARGKQDDPPQAPYLIGVYGSGEVFDYCYKQGITSYYWEAAAPIWTKTEKPWVHVNVWQVAQPGTSNFGAQDMWNCPAEQNVPGTGVTYQHDGLTDPSKSWLHDQWAGNPVFALPVVAGTQRIVKTNDAHSVTFAADWAIQPADGTGYVVAVMPDVDVSYGDEGMWKATP